MCTNEVIAEQQTTAFYTYRCRSATYTYEYDYVFESSAIALLFDHIFSTFGSVFFEKFDKMCLFS